MAYLRSSLVTKKQWLDDEGFLAALEISQALPGLNATNMSVIVGDRLRGLPGAIAGFVGITLPGALLVFVLGLFYATNASNPWVNAALKGVGAAGRTAPRVTLQIGHKQLEHRLDVTLVALTLVLVSFLHVPLAYVLLTVGPLAIFLYRPHPSRPLQPTAAASTKARRLSHEAPPTPRRFFAALGARHWRRHGRSAGNEAAHGGLHGVVTDAPIPRHLRDRPARAGPNMLMVIVIGYKVAGIAGALTAFAGFFAPACAIAIVCSRIWNRFEGSPWRLAIQRGMAPIVVGLMLAGTISIARTAIVGKDSEICLAFAAVVFIALYFGKKMNPALLILAGAVLGLVFLR